MKILKWVLCIFLISLLVLGTTPVSGREFVQTKVDGGAVINGLSLVGQLDTNYNATEVAVSGDYAYLCGGGALEIIDISNPTTPVLVGTYTPPDWTQGPCMTMAVAGNYVVTAGYAMLNIIDVSNPATPIRVGQYAYGAPIPHGIDVAGAYAYVVETQDTSPYYYYMRVFNISNVANPVLIKTVPMSYVPNDIEVVGSYAYVSNFELGLRVFDVSNPIAPVEVGSYDTPHFSSQVTISGSYAWLSEGGWGLEIVDISNPSAPYLVKEYDPSSGYVENIAVAWGYAYIAYGEGGLLMLDVANLTEPTLVGQYDTTGSARDVVAADGLIYVADYDKGLVILESTFMISGSATIPDNIPICGATVTATGGYTTTTNSLGKFSFMDLPPGDYTVAISMPGLTFTPGSFEVILPPNAQVDFVSDGLFQTYIPMILK
jgi:hypothetical protein